MSAEAVLNCKELSQWAVDLISDDFFIGDEDVLEDGLVELATDFVACAHVEGVGVFEQSQVGLKELGPLAEVIGDSGEFGSELLALASDIGEAGTDLALRKGAIRCEVEEVFLFRVEVDQLSFELLAKKPLCCLSVGERGFHSGAHGSDEGGGKSDGLVVILNCLVDPIDVGVRGVAAVILCADAEEVEVFVALTADRSLEDEALDRVVLEAASPAVESAFEIVRMHSTAFARDRPRLQERLNPVEELLVDEGRVASVIFLALERDLA